MKIDNIWAKTEKKDKILGFIYKKKNGKFSELCKKVNNNYFIDYLFLMNYIKLNDNDSWKLTYFGEYCLKYYKNCYIDKVEERKRKLKKLNKNKLKQFFKFVFSFF